MRRVGVGLVEKEKRGKSEKTHVGQNRILNHSQFAIVCEGYTQSR